jgi:hypothetical protein
MLHKTQIKRTPYKSIYAHSFPHLTPGSTKGQPTLKNYHKGRTLSAGHLFANRGKSEKLDRLEEDLDDTQLSNRHESAFFGRISETTSSPHQILTFSPVSTRKSWKVRKIGYFSFVASTGKGCPFCLVENSKIRTDYGFLKNAFLCR